MTHQSGEATSAVATGRRVLRLESQALATMADDLPGDFAAIVDLIGAMGGRVIVSGVGKSGHIGRKIAATLASTGTPAYFVHATEASHGDLGMIGKGDVCLLISNSGETAELRDLVYHTQRFSIPLIGLSSNPGSTLMKTADYRLTLPNVPEACSIGMAPTTSTTLTLAIGDALAVALMEQKAFKTEDFGVFHPGGKLGAQMRRVDELMHDGADVPVLPTGATIEDTLLVMTSKGFGLAALVDGAGRLTGVITDGDLRRNMTGLMARQPEDIANPTPITVAPGALAAEALALLNKHKISALIIINPERQPVGVLHIHDILRAGVA